MSRANRERREKNRQMALDAIRENSAHVGGIRLNSPNPTTPKGEPAPKGSLPIISPHDIRLAPADTHSTDDMRPVLQMMAVSAMMHTEPPSQELPDVVFIDERENRGGILKQWECGPYYGLFRGYIEGFPIGNGPFAILSISRKDETACKDWRDFQQLKNKIVGSEWEAAELYPAESRLMDPSNRFYLWCVPKGVFVFGLVGRSVLDAGQGIAPQRPFPRSKPEAVTDDGQR